MTERIAPVTVLVRGVVPVPVAMVARRAHIRVFAPSRAGESVREEDISQVIDQVESHIHPASGRYESIPFPAPHVQETGGVVVKAPHTLGEQGYFPLHPGPGHVPEYAIHRVAWFQDCEYFFPCLFSFKGLSFALRHGVAPSFSAVRRA
mgnify:CR=1 FL=1